MKYFLSVIFCFLLLESTHAMDYETIYLPKMIEKSDLIIHGEIISVDTFFIEVVIHTSLKGSFAQKRIRILQFENWTCAWRWSDYETGQEELFFLRRDQKSGNWFPMGAGNEGELPIESEHVFYKSFRSYPYCTAETHPLNSGKIHGCAFELEQALTAIKEFSLKNKTFHSLAETDQLKSYETDNPFLALVLFELDRSYERKRRRNE